MRVGHDEWRLLLRVLGSSSRIVPQSSARQAKEVAASRETSSCDTEVRRAANKSEPAAKSIATENYASDVGGGRLTLHAGIGSDGNVGHNALLIRGKLIGVPWDAAARGWHNAAVRVIPAVAVNCETRKSK